MEPDAEMVTLQDNLFKVMEQMTSTDINQLKFLCSGIIPVGNLEKMDITDLLKNLNERNTITLNNLDFLVVCLILIGRLDIVHNIGYDDHTIKELTLHLQEYNNIAGLHAFKILLFNFADNMTEEEVKKLTFYLDERLNYSRGKLKKCITGFDLMAVFVKANYVNSENFANLYDVAKQLERMDLVKKIDNYSAKNKLTIGITKAIKQENFKGNQQVTTSVKKEIDQGTYNLNEESDWQKLIANIPSEKHYYLCESLGVSPKKYKLFKEKIGGLLHKDFAEKLFNISTLKDTFVKLDIKTPQLITNEDRSLNPEKYLEKYIMTSKPRGICLILNNEVFSNQKLKERKGSEVDKKSLVDVFTKFHFEIIEADNLERKKMEEKLREVALKDHTHYNCFVCCILSHGKEDGIYGVDGELMPYRMLTIPFKPNQCQSLKGKPKLFFVQACQGESYQYGCEDYETDGVKPPLIPNEADFLIANATVHGYVSFRSMSKGSWFIQKLCEVFTENAKRFDLSDMLLMVNNSVSQSEGLIKKGPPVKQVPAPLSTLRKKVYFLDD